MTKWRLPFGNDLFDEDFVTALCTICGKPRLQCAEDVGLPFTEVEEEK